MPGVENSGSINAPAHTDNQAEVEMPLNGAEPYIILKVKSQDGPHVFFKQSATQKLRKLMNSYCDRESLDFSSTLFLYNGRHLQGDQTPAELEMEDEDEIHAIHHMTDIEVLVECGESETNHVDLKGITVERFGVNRLKSTEFIAVAGSSDASPVYNNPVQANAEEVEKPRNHRGRHINLKVNGQDGREVLFRVKKTISLRKLMKCYCNRESMDPSSVLFLFGGRRIRSNQTPAELQMKAGDEINAMHRDHQTGKYVSVQSKESSQGNRRHATFS